MLPQLPEPVRHPSVIRAAVSPSAAIVTAAGVGIGVLDRSVVLAVVLGAGAWLGRMAVAVIRARGRSTRSAPAAIDPWAVPEPWRQYVRQALSARQRFDQTLEQWPAGPLQDRLASLQPRLAQGAEEVWAVARQGATLGGATGGGDVAGRPSTAQLSAELQRVQAERQRAGPDATDRRASLARSEGAIAAQLRAARRSEEARAEVLDRLRLLTARLDEAVTQLLELGLEQTGGADEGSAAVVAGSVDALVEEIAALHQGLREAGEAGAAAGSSNGEPPGRARALPPSPPATS